MEMKLLFGVQSQNLFPRANMMKLIELGMEVVVQIQSVYLIQYFQNIVILIILSLF